MWYVGDAGFGVVRVPSDHDMMVREVCRIPRKKGHGCGRRPKTPAVRLYFGEIVVKRYERYISAQIASKQLLLLSL